MIATLNKRGGGHNSCQDNLFVQEQGDYIYGCISDGCSSGYKAEFASQLFIYLLQQAGLEIQTETTLQILRWRVRDMYHVLRMPSIHALSATLVIFMYNIPAKLLSIRVLGDGYYRVNGVEYIVDQNNIPDYFGFHVGDTNDDFMRYIRKYPLSIFHNVTSFQICSDGIQSFQLPQFKDDPGLNPKAEMLDAKGAPNILERKFNILTRKGYQIADDLSIISYHETE